MYVCVCMGAFESGFYVLILGKTKTKPRGTMKGGQKRKKTKKQKTKNKNKTLKKEIK